MPEQVTNECMGDLVRTLLETWSELEPYAAMVRQSCLRRASAAMP